MHADIEAPTQVALGLGRRPFSEKHSGVDG